MFNSSALLWRLHDLYGLNNGCTPPITANWLYHHDDVIMSTMASQITGVLFCLTLVQAQITENIRAPRHWPLCGISPVTGEFPAQKASNAGNVSIWWRHHGTSQISDFALCTALGDIWFSRLAEYLVIWSNFGKKLTRTTVIDPLPYAWLVMGQRFHIQDDVIKWKHFLCYWPFVRRIHGSPHKGQWRGALMFSLVCERINAWLNNRQAGYLRRHRAHYDVM